MNRSKASLFPSRRLLARWLARSLLITAVQFTLVPVQSARADTIRANIDTTQMDNESSRAVADVAGAHTMANPRAINHGPGPLALVVPVPEPSSGLLLVMGLLSLAAVQWSRRRLLSRDPVAVLRR